MAVKISGVLKDGTGKPVQNCTIQLKAKRNSTTVVVNTLASENPDEAGRYSMDVEYGQYSVILLVEGFPPSHAGTITVYEDSQPGTLNDFLGAMTEDDARPEALRRFELMVEEVARNASAVAQNTAAAKKSASDASTSAREAATHATDAAGSARAASTSAGQAASSAQSASSSAGTASTKATEAEKSAAAAESSKSAAATSARAAKTSETNAAASQQSAATSASTATTKASEAATSARDAAASKEAAKSSETSAASSASSAASSATAAGNSAKAAKTSETNARSSETAAAQNASAAADSETAAETSANAAATKATEAADSAAEAERSKSTAESAATRAETAAKRAEDIASAVGLEDASTTKKGIVQLSSAANSTSEAFAATPKAVKIVMDETKTKAPLDSPAFTGTPTTPTPPDDAVGLEMANAAFVRKLLAALVDSSPEALDTLNELAAALGNDPEFSTTVINALAGKQPLNDLLTAISELTKRADNLLYFNQDGNVSLSPLSEKARALLAQDTPEAMRTELELKAAATMEPQSNIRDRTPGRLALSGMYGFGQAFTSTEALAFNGQADFAEWLKEATPGRYAVSIADSSTLLTGTTKFNGIIDVMWSPFDNDESDTTRKFKTLLCFNQYYEGEHSIHRLTYRWSGNNWNATVSPIIYDGDSLAFLLSRTAGTDSSSYYKYPAVGVPIFAVYRGLHLNDDDKKITQGDVVQGSRLSPLAILCSAGDTGIFTGNPRFLVGTPGSSGACAGFPGRYMALSGQNATTTLGQYGYACLFVRIE
ncbi:prophage tail fiber N-terminal domain-containing protein [Escherichia coli]|nr:prophage tail fiber N-terminal domain-containing protein [Escherichia coli]